MIVSTMSKKRNVCETPYFTGIWLEILCSGEAYKNLLDSLSVFYYF